MDPGILLNILEAVPEIGRRSSDLPPLPPLTRTPDLVPVSGPGPGGAGFTPYTSKTDKKRAQRATRHIPYAETEIVATARRTIFLRTANTPPPTGAHDRDYLSAANIALAQAGAPAHVRFHTIGFNGKLNLTGITRPHVSADALLGGFRDILITALRVVDGDLNDIECNHTWAAVKIIGVDPRLYAGPEGLAKLEAEIPAFNSIIGTMTRPPRWLKHGGDDTLGTIVVSVISHAIAVAMTKQKASLGCGFFRTALYEPDAAAYRRSRASPPSSPPPPLTSRAAQKAAPRPAATTRLGNAIRRETTRSGGEIAAGACEAPANFINIGEMLGASESNSSQRLQRSLPSGTTSGHERQVGAPYPWLGNCAAFPQP